MAELDVYVETSVWSCAFAQDVPDYRRDTLAFFDQCRKGRLGAFASDVVLEEMDRSEPTLRERLLNLVRDVGPTILELTPPAERLAESFLRERVVPRGKPEDAHHVAMAFVEELDVLVSWNFRHIAGMRRADRFNAVAVLERFYKPLRIVSPGELLYDDGPDAL